MSKHIPLGARTPKSSTRSPRISSSNSSKIHTQVQPVRVHSTSTLAAPFVANKILLRSQMRSVGSGRNRRVSVHAGVHQHETTAAQTEEITQEDGIQRLLEQIITGRKHIILLDGKKDFIEIADSTEVDPPVTVNLQNLLPSRTPLLSPLSSPNRALWRAPQLPSASERSQKQSGPLRLRQQTPTQVRKITQKGRVKRLIEELFTERRSPIGRVDSLVLRLLEKTISQHQFSPHASPPNPRLSSNKIQQRPPQLPSASERSQKQSGPLRLRQQESTQIRRSTREEEAQRRLTQIKTDREIATRLNAGECVAEISESTAVSPRVVRRVWNRLSDGEDLDCQTPKEIGWMRSAGEIDDADMLQKLKHWKYTFSEIEDDAVVRRGDWDDIEALYAEHYLSTQEYRELLNTARKIRDESGKQDN